MKNLRALSRFKRLNQTHRTAALSANVAFCVKEGNLGLSAKQSSLRPQTRFWSRLGHLQIESDFDGVTTLLTSAFVALLDEESVKSQVERFLFDYFCTNEFIPSKAVRAALFAETFGICEAEDCLDAFSQFLSFLKSSNVTEEHMELVEDLLEAVVTNFVELTYMKTRSDIVVSQATNSYQMYSAGAVQALHCLSLWAEHFPNSFLKFLDVLLPFLTTDGFSEDKSAVICILSAFDMCIKKLDNLSAKFMATADKLLLSHLQTSHVPVIRCLFGLRNHFGFTTKLFTLFSAFLKEANVARLALEVKKQRRFVNSWLGTQNLDTILSLLGMVACYFEVDLMLLEDSKAAESLYVSMACEHEAELESLARHDEKPFFNDVRSLLEAFINDPNGLHLHAAYEALGYLTAAQPEMLRTDPIKTNYIQLLLSTDAADNLMKTAVLRNLNVFVNRQGEKLEDTGEGSKGRNPITKDLMTTMHIYWDSINGLMYSNDSELRLASAKLITNLIARRLIVPHHSASLLIAMISDPDIQIHKMSLRCLKSINQLLAQNEAINGIRGSFKLQKAIHKFSVARGYRKEQDDVAILDSYYRLWRGDKTLRRNILPKVIAMLNITAIDDLEESLTINELLYVVDNLATFSYVNLDEPLIVIRAVDEALKRNEMSTLQEFEQKLKSQEEDDVDMSQKSVFDRLPDDKIEILPAYVNLVKISLLKALKNHLIRRYTLKAKDLEQHRVTSPLKSAEVTLTRKPGGVKGFQPRFIEKYLKHEGAEQSWKIVAQHFASAYTEFLNSATE
ncbi:hypothetical protein L596_014180 [Steinernema carpocapsae]|uniref:Nipped-B protein n=1 Tax=Steinernema carpocapsae TaxID=34508 RepID=A0A4V6A2Q9_STECR|nr:hypothetical protein L596_014180 [Steinernema carpocapsae]